MAIRRVTLLVLLLLVAAVVIPASPAWAQSGQPTATSGAVEVLLRSARVMGVGVS